MGEHTVPQLQATGLISLPTLTSIQNVPFHLVYKDT